MVVIECSMAATTASPVIVAHEHHPHNHHHHEQRLPMDETPPQDPGESSMTDRPLGGLPTVSGYTSSTCPTQTHSQVWNKEAIQINHSAIDENPTVSHESVIKDSNNKDAGEDDNEVTTNHEMTTTMELPSTTRGSEENTLLLTEDKSSRTSNMSPSSSSSSTIYTGPIISTRRQTGQVKFFSREKGFGFIIPDEDAGVDVFVHHTAIHGTRGVKGLVEYETVEYDLVQGPKGMQAINVTAPGGGLIHRKPVSSPSGPFSSTPPSMMNLNLLTSTGFGYQPVMTPDGLIAYVPIAFSTGGDLPSYLSMMGPNQTPSNFSADPMGDPTTSPFLRMIPPFPLETTTTANYLPTTTRGRLVPPLSPPPTRVSNNSTNSHGVGNPPTITVPALMTTPIPPHMGGSGGGTMNLHSSSSSGNGDANHHVGQRMNGMMMVNGHHPNPFVSGSMDLSSSLHYPAWYAGNQQQQQHAYQMMAAALMASSNPTLNGMMSSMSQPHQQHPLQQIDSFPMTYMPTMQQPYNGGMPVFSPLIFMSPTPSSSPNTSTNNSNPGSHGRIDSPVSSTEPKSGIVESVPTKTIALNETSKESLTK
jgi:cold shock CspA family protein